MKQYIRYVLFSLIILLCRLLPGRFLYWIALRVADLNYLFDSRGVKAVQANLRQVLPGAGEERIVYESRWVFRNFGKYLTEFFRFRSFGRRFFDKHVAVNGQEHVDKALAAGKGAILLSAHLSNWELGAAAMHMVCGYKVNVIAAMHRYGRVNNLFMRERESMGIRVIDARNAPRRVIAALRDNEVVGILGDRDPSEAGVEVDFFGRPCRFPQGPARLALSTGAPLIPGFVLRRTNDSFTIFFEPPVETPPESLERAERVRLMTQAYAKKVENAIRWHPEEWGVFYNVWDEEWAE